MKYKICFLLLLVVASCARITAQKKNFSYTNLMEETNTEVQKINDSVLGTDRGVNFKGDINEELPAFNKNYRGSFNRFVQKDLSYVITGDPKGNAFNNKFAIDPVNPSMTLALSYWLGRNNPGKKTVYNMSNCTSEEVDRKQMSVLPMRIALGLELSAASKNNVATLFTTSGNAINSDLTVKPSLVFVFQGIYKLSNAECFGKLKNDILKKQRSIQDKIALSAYLQKKIQKKIDSLQNEIDENTDGETRLPTNADLDFELKAHIRTAKEKLEEEEAEEEYQRDNLMPAVDRVIYNFPYKSRTYYWLSLTGDWAWHNYARFTPGLSMSDNTLDEVRFATYTFGPAFNVMFTGAPNSWASSFYAGTKLMFGETNNAINATPKTYSIYTEQQVSDSAVIYTSDEGDAYDAADFVKYWKVNWNSNFIWYVDPQHIVGLNVFLDMTKNLSSASSKIIWTLGQGIVFAVPSPKKDDQCVTNFTLFVQEVDLQKATSTTNENGVAKGKWYNKVTLGFKVGVPFGIFGPKK